MAIQKTDKIWHNGKYIAWDDATLHVMAHVVNYGSSLFEGIRCYSHSSGPAIFRAHEHMQRLIDSSKIYRIEVPYTREELVSAMVELVGLNKVWPCYIRPIVLRGYVSRPSRRPPVPSLTDQRQVLFVHQPVEDLVPAA